MPLVAYLIEDTDVRFLKGVELLEFPVDSERQRV